MLSLLWKSKKRSKWPRGQEPLSVLRSLENIISKKLSKPRSFQRETMWKGELKRDSYRLLCSWGLMIRSLRSLLMLWTRKLFNQMSLSLRKVIKETFFILLNQESSAVPRSSMEQRPFWRPLMLVTFSASWLFSTTPLELLQFKLTPSPNFGFLTEILSIISSRKPLKRREQSTRVSSPLSQFCKIWFITKDPKWPTLLRKARWRMEMS